MNAPEERLLKVSGGTDPQKLAESILATYAEGKHKKVILRSIGAGSLNQGVKACILANKSLFPKGIYCALIPYFKDVMEPSRAGTTEEKITAIELSIHFLGI
jgi:stage V sporulation protein SpoVS